MNTFAKLFVAAGFLACQADAKTIKILVGESGLSFSPNSLTADVNDILEFHFYPSNHSVVAGDFSSGCQPAKSNGFFSGFVPVSSGSSDKAFQVQVTSTDPLVFYCSQAAHCKSGMYGVVNPASSGDKTLSAYGALAKAASNSGSPSAVSGGNFVSASGSSSSSGSSTSTGTGSSTTQTGSPYGGGSGSGSSTTGGGSSSTSSGSSSQTSKSNSAGTIRASITGLLGVAVLSMYMM